jgi:hypothetical protein
VGRAESQRRNSRAPRVQEYSVQAERPAFQIAKSHLMALIKSQIQPSMAMAMAVK